MLKNLLEYLKRVGYVTVVGGFLSLLFLILINLNTSHVPYFSDDIITRINRVLTYYQTKYPYIKAVDIDKRINEIIEEINGEYYYISHEINYVGRDHVNIFFTIGEESPRYISFLLSRIDGQKQNISALFRSNTINIFNDVVEEALNNKYPRFIVDSLNGEGNIAYNIQNDRIIIYFSGFEINPNPNKDIYVIINNYDIKDILISGFEINPDLVDENIFTLDKNRKTVAITFDDGPLAGTTDAIVEILRDNKMHATFFMLGRNMRNFPDLVKYVLANGNEIGSHTYSHPNIARISQEQFNFQMNETNRIFRDITGNDLIQFRPPYGLLTQRIRETLNMPIILWSVDPRDWEFRDARAISEHILENIEDGDIILLHDIYLTTVEAVRILLPELYVRGFQVVSVSTLAELKGRTMENNTIYFDFK